MEIHVFRTGRLTGNRTFMRSESYASMLRRRENYEFPALCFVLEHPEGLIAIDTGMNRGAHAPRSQRRFCPVPEPEEEIGTQMRAAGLRPEDVRQVIVTHLDWDHVGGIGHFPHAEALVHRPELEMSRTLGGRMRYQTRRWPQSFTPTAYDMDPEPYGPFPASRVVTDNGDVRVVPIAGHSAGQVGVVVEEDGGPSLLFAADHMLRQDWFLEDYAAGRLLSLGIWFADEARQTSHRIHQFVTDRPTVLVPSHDDDAPRRLQARETAGARAAVSSARP